MAAGRKPGHHALVTDPGILDDPADAPPAQPFEERHVRGLDVRLHLPAASRSGLGDCEAHQWSAEAVAAVLGQDRQPITLPPAVAAAERVQPHGPAGDPVRQADHVDGRRVVVAGVTVVTAGVTVVTAGVTVVTAGVNALPANNWRPAAPGAEHPLLDH